MRKNLLKQLIMVLLLTIAVPILNAQVAHVGDILCEGNAIVSPANYPSSGATAIGVVFYVDNTGQHGWAVALQDATPSSWGGCGGQWSSCSDTPLVNLNSKRQAIYDLNGFENTRIVREYSSDFGAFNAVDFENGWYLPAIGQLNYLYGNVVEVNASILLVGGTKFNSGQYWSSTESSQDGAWFLTSSGELYNYDAHSNGWYDWKGTTRGIRAARNF